jgi:hypothetical protein
MLYVGVDAHKSTSQITVMNEAGVILQRKSVHSTSEGFKAALAGFNEPFKAVLEASYSWGPMYDWLDDALLSDCNEITQMTQFHSSYPYFKSISISIQSIC